MHLRQDSGIRALLPKQLGNEQENGKGKTNKQTNQKKDENDTEQLQI